MSRSQWSLKSRPVLGPAAIRRAGLLAIAVALSLLSIQTSRAATITVGQTSCTLWQAIQSANTDTAVGACTAGSGADTLDLSNLSATTNINAFTPLDDITSEITISGANKTLSAELNTRHFTVNRGGKLTLINITLSARNATTGKVGGALLVNAGGEAIVRNSSLSQNAASKGGAIYSSGSLTIINSDFPSNQASHDSGLALGGAIYQAGGSMTITGSSVGSIYGANSADAGGGIYIAGGSATITQSAIERNAANSGDGGGIYVASGARLTISSSLLYENSASATGGGIYFAGRSANISHVTFFDNRSTDSQSNSRTSGLYVASGSVSLRNSIISSQYYSHADCGGSRGLSQSIGNLIEDNTCSPAASGNPNLGSAAGSPPYYLPNSGSPALGIGDAAICKAFLVDQRGYYRPETACDAGSVERNGYNPIFVNANANNSPDTVCTLSEAFTGANSDNQQTGCRSGVADSVAIDLIRLGLDVTLSGGVADPTTTIILDGAGHTVSKESSAGDFRAITVETNGDLTIRNITMQGFRVTSGAAVLNKARLTLEDCVFKDNIDDSGSAGGGAVRIEPTNQGTTIDRCVFQSNESLTAKGGAILVSGGDVTIRNSSFINNDSVADSAGAIFFEGGSSTVHNNTFIGNTCSGSGCAVFNNGGTVDLTHNTFWDNVSDTSGNTDTVYHGSGSTYLRNSILGHSAPRTNTICGGSIDAPGADHGRVVWNGPDAHGCGDTSLGGATVGDPKFGAQTGSPLYLPLGAGSAAIGRGNATWCAAFPIDQKGDPRPASGCDAGAAQRIVAASLGDSASPARAAQADSAAPDVPACTGELLNNTGNYRITVSYGLCSGVQFNQLQISAIGIGYVIEAGPLDAIDVWGWVTATVEVCFRRHGATLFLDAADSPRTVGQLASTWDGEWTCAKIDRAGTIVLLPADSYLTTPPADVLLTADITPLASCMANLDYSLNLREAPGGAIMQILPFNISLTAFQLSGDWVEVDYYGTRGWISARHVTFIGSC